MAKKMKTVDETSGSLVIQDTNSEPCWHRHPDRAASCCEVEIDLGGPTFIAYAEITEQEERETKDLSALKNERLRETLEVGHAKAMEYLNG